MAEQFSSNEEFLAEMERRRAAAGQNRPPEAAPSELPGPKITPHREVKETGLIGMLLKLGVAKNAQQANYILIGVMVAVLAITAWVIWG